VAFLFPKNQGASHHCYIINICVFCPHTISNIPNKTKMHPIIRNILAVIAGLLIGGAVNMGIVMMGPHVIPPPNSADTTTMEGLKVSMHLFQPRHFIFPFLAHAIGTFVGAWLAVLIAANHKLKFAMIIGVAFLIGGILNIVMLPSPLWFTALDVVGAYLPMGYLAWMVAGKKRALSRQ
jgi:hypothetical protein